MPASQWQQGNQNVQIAGVVGATIQITFNGSRRRVPLQPATIAPGARVASPARLLRARSGVIPYSARAGLLTELEAWATSTGRFAGCLVGGRGGSGKTRLAVELCERASAAGWLCGLLEPAADLGALEALIDLPTPRLVVVDYAESRVEQLAVLLPELAAAASEEACVRVLLLVRAPARPSDDWTAALRHRTDGLDAVLDDVEVHTLDELALSQPDRQVLFAAAARALAERAGTGLAVSDPPGQLAQAVFASPLLVVIAAYLAQHDSPNSGAPTTAAALFDELLAHEHRYWEARDRARGLGCSEVVRQRVVALATLTGAIEEPVAVECLRLLPDLTTVSSERCGEIARWAHELYPGPGWWNPLEPDRIGEHLVAHTFASSDDNHARVHRGQLPAVLAGVLRSDEPQRLVGPLDLFARAIPEHPGLAALVAPVLSTHVQRLCALAAEQVAGERDLDLLLGQATLAGSLERAIRAITLETDTLREAIAALPRRRDVILGPLALALTTQAVSVYRRLATDDLAAHRSDLARSLNNLSVWLAEAGRLDEGLAASQEAVSLHRRLAADDPAAYQPDLATSLNTFSSRLAEAGRLDEGLAASQEGVTVRRRLAEADPAAHEPGLARSLNNLSIRLAELGRRDDGLAAIQKAVTVYRRLAAGDPAAYEPDLASSLTTLSIRLAGAERRDEGLAAIQEAVTMRRRLAAANPAAYQPDLARALNNLSVRLAKAGRHHEGLAASQEAVSVHRRLASASPAARDPDLAIALHNLSNRLTETGRDHEGLAAIQEAVTMRRRLAAANPAAYQPDLASSLNNLSVRLAKAGRHREGLAAIHEAVTVYRQLASAHPATYDSDLARALNNLSKRLAENERPAEADRARADALALQPEQAHTDAG